MQQLYGLFATAKILAGRQTGRQTNKHQVKYNLLGRVSDP